MKFYLSLLALTFFTLSLEAQSMKKKIRYLALGDSYTIGESVKEKERWPVQLANYLATHGVVVEDLEIIATTGWTTDELAEGIKEANPQGFFHLVSLLIGVNNQYRTYPIETFRKEFEALLQEAIAFAGEDNQQVIVLSIPDYGLTPFVEERGRDPEKIAKELDEYNAISLAICQQYGVSFFDITGISREASDNPDLIANDGLHPSGEMYRLWVERIRETVLNKFK